MGGDKPYQPQVQEILPIVAEELIVRKQEVETGKVRISTPVRERTVHVDESCFREEVNVEHVPANRYLDEAVAVRQEGDTTIVPVVEEHLVLVRRLFLKEEIHITRRRVEERVAEDVTLRFQEAEVQRIEASS